MRGLGVVIVMLKEDGISVRKRVLDGGGKKYKTVDKRAGCGEGGMGILTFDSQCVDDWVAIAFLSISGFLTY
jgi:hypothetical protein